MLHPEHRFAVYDRRTMTPLTNLVRVGRGPNEYNYLTPGQRTCNDEGSGFWFYSGSKQESARLNLTKSITEDKVCIDSRLLLTELDIPGNVGSPGQLFAFDRIMIRLRCTKSFGELMFQEGFMISETNRNSAF